jgi:hypothetical protein
VPEQKHQICSRIVIINRAIFARHRLSAQQLRNFARDRSVEPFADTSDNFPRPAVFSC